jgi:polyhydroxybutyrate depolymerase
VAAVGPDRPGDVAQTFTTADGAVRTYRLGVPEDYDPDVPVPLVLNLHGAGSNGEQASTYGDVPRAATRRGMITIAPDAVDGRWEIGEGADSAFLAALLDDVEGRYCIDLDRVHGLGMSLGAWKVASVACGLGDRIASLALVTVEVFPGGCDPMPVVAFHGTDDNVAAYGEGGGTVAPEDATANQGITGTRDNMARWAESGGCDPGGVEEPVGDDVLWLRYDGCDEGVSVELYSIVGGGHTWPGSDIVLGAPEHTTETIDATALALDFFEDHPR